MFLRKSKVGEKYRLNEQKSRKEIVVKRGELMCLLTPFLYSVIFTDTYDMSHTKIALIV